MTRLGTCEHVDLRFWLENLLTLRQEVEWMGGLPTRTLGGVLRVVRVGLLVVLFFVAMSIVIAIGRPETGPLEDGVLAAVAGGLFVLAVPVRRIGRALA